MDITSLRESSSTANDYDDEVALRSSIYPSRCLSLSIPFSQFFVHCHCH